MKFNKVVKGSVIFLMATSLLLGQSFNETDLGLGDDVATEAEKKAEAARKAVAEQEKIEAEKKKKEEAERLAREREANETSDSTTARDTGPGTIFTDGKVTYASCNTKFQLESADSLSKLAYIEYRVDDSPLRKYRSPFSIEEEGVHRITYRGIDKVGNIEPQSMLEVIVDCTPPDVSSVSNPATYEKDGLSYLPAKSTIELKAVDKYSGVDKIQYQVDNGEWVDYKEPITFDKLAKKHGQTQIKYRALDKLGNTSEGQTFATFVDGMPPTLEIKSAQRLVSIDGKTYSMRSNFFTIKASDADSGINKIVYKIDGQGEFQTYTTPLNFTVEGPHSIEAKAIDNAGNESELKKLEFLVDDNPPKTTIKPINVKTLEGSNSSTNESTTPAN